MLRKKISERRNRIIAIGWITLRVSYESHTSVENIRPQPVIWFATFCVIAIQQSRYTAQAHLVYTRLEIWTLARIRAIRLYGIGADMRGRSIAQNETLLT